jgi:hypothetical protein
MGSLLLDGAMDRVGAHCLSLGTSKILKMSMRATPEFGERVGGVYEYLASACLANPHNATIPCMLVPAMLGMKYDQVFHQANFVRDFLKPGGRQGVDWKFMDRAKLFPDGCNTHTFHVPGTGTSCGVDSEPLYLTLNRGKGPNEKFPYVTPLFARRMALMSRTDMGRFFSLLHLEISELLHTEVSEARWAWSVASAHDSVLSSFFMTSDRDTTHNDVRDAIALFCGGQTEVCNKAGISDVETTGEVIEVKPAHQWTHGMGQVLAYAAVTGKHPVLALFGPHDDAVCNRVCAQHGVKILRIP